LTKFDQFSEIYGRGGTNGVNNNTGGLLMNGNGGGGNNSNLNPTQNPLAAAGLGTNKSLNPDFGGVYANSGGYGMLSGGLAPSNPTHSATNRFPSFAEDFLKQY
jgi:hypothetical protein